MSSHDDRLIRQTNRILATFLTEPAAEWPGPEIAPAAGLKPGSIYPVLIRMERLGFLTSRWEEVDTPPPDLREACTRPRRRLYRLSAVGQRTAEALRSGTPMAR